MKFVLRRKEIDITREDIEKVKERVSGGRGKTYFVRINGKTVPVKDLLYEVLRLKRRDFTLLDFTTADAVRILRKLGIEIKHTGAGTNAKAILKFAGVLEMGGNALEDERGLYR
ncbi:MAG: hypothetical protein Q8J64_00690 [Thermodesulfovibrionales bacterium]|nr:hypothetical protein [Thermodesulfovibrionales bacterium]